MIIHPMTHLLNGVAPLPHLGVIRAQGEEAARFLHNQLTQDFALLKPGQARLAAFCTPKGRMLASFVAFERAPGEVLLACSRDVLPATLKRLSMFVLRSKVKLTDATGEIALLGLAGEAAAPAAAAWTVREAHGGQAVQLYPAEGQPRALWFGAAGAPVPPGPRLDSAVWEWGEVRSGVATVSAPVVEAFVPQMLNYESVGGVNFKKGCYPGRRWWRAASSAAPSSAGPSWSTARPN